jgi:hypothetical protein
MVRAARCCRITFAEFANTFVPFGLLLAVALVAPELTQNVTLHRVIYTIWLSTALLIPGLCLVVLPGRSGARQNYALLFTTFSYLAYMVHFYYAAFVVFGGINGVLENMRPWVAWTNLGLTAWWTMDMLVAWLAPPDWMWVRVERGAMYIFLFLVYSVTDLFLRPGPVRYLGVALVAAVLFCLLVRLGHRAAAVAPVSPSR